MSWLFSQALVEEYLGENFSDGKQSAPLNGKPTQQAYCAPDKMTDFSRLSQFGMMYKPLTANLGEELLTLYLEDFLAKTSAQQEKAQELTENEAECGQKWLASFVKYDPDTSLWRTHQCSLLGDLEEFLETWPQWGLMRNGECWEQRTLEQTIRGTESGLSESWPTPRSCSAMAATITPESAWNDKRNPNLETIVGQRLWPTTTAHMAKETNAPSEHTRNTPTLTAQVNWLTPRTKGMCGGSGAWAQLKANTTIEEARSMGAGNGGKLNPTWVEWLMGWPLGWTDLKPLEMDKFHCVQQQLGES
jgi:hypothetical protein